MDVWILQLKNGGSESLCDLPKVSQWAKCIYLLSQKLLIWGMEVHVYLYSQHWGGGCAEAGGSPGIGGQSGLHSGEKMRDPISKSKHTQPIYIALKMLYNIEKSWSHSFKGNSVSLNYRGLISGWGRVKTSSVFTAFRVGSFPKFNDIFIKFIHVYVCAET